MKLIINRISPGVKSVRSALAICACLCMFQIRVIAAMSTWIAPSTSGNWNTSSNWSGGAVPGAADSIILSGSSGKSPWTMSAITLEVSDIAYNLSGNDRRLRNDSTATDSILVLNGTSTTLLMNLMTGRNFSINALGGGAVPHLLTVQLKTSGTFNSSGTAGDATLGGSGLVINAPITESGGSRSLALTGPGAITLSGTNSYTGGTIVAMTGGTVWMSGSGTAGVFNGTLGAPGSPLSIQSGTLDLGSSSQRVGVVTITGGLVQSGTLTGDSFLATGSGTSTINSVIAGSGDLTKSGSGKLVLGGSNTYTGKTNVTDGTLVVSGNISGSLCQLSGGTLRGSGTAGVLVVQSAGTISPGIESGPGILSVASLELQAGSHLVIRLGGTVAGAGYDQLAVSGEISLAGDLQGSLINGFNPASATVNPETLHINLDGDKFFIASGSGITGNFSNEGPANVNLPGFGTVMIGGREFAISYSGNAVANSFTGGTDVVLMAIPETNILGMMLCGLAVITGIGGSRRFGRLGRYPAKVHNRTGGSHLCRSDVVNTGRDYPCG